MHYEKLFRKKCKFTEKHVMQKDIFADQACSFAIIGIVIQIEKALICDGASASKVTGTFRIPTIYDFAVIYP